MSSTRTFPRDLRIDLLRGLAILSVLVLHFHLAYNLLKSPLGRFLPGPYLVNLVWNGNYGVTVFFVVSGYLIASTSLRRFGSLGDISVRTFYLFRFARIFPCLLLALGSVTGLALTGVSIFRNGGSASIWLADLSVLTFWHNILMAHLGYFNYCLNVYWSLSVEEVFYLAFPLLCALLRRPRWLISVWIVAIAAGPVYRSFHRQDEILFLYGNLACFDAIAMGCLAAACVGSKKAALAPVARGPIQVAALGWMMWIFLRTGIDASPVLGPSLIAVGAAVFLLAEGLSGTLEYRDRSFVDKLSAPLAWLGRHSYELYLFHILLLAGMRTIVNPQSTAPAWKPILLAVFLGLSALLAWAIARFYSEPLNRGIRQRWRKRWLPQWQAN